MNPHPSAISTTSATQNLMLYDPATGVEKPYPSHVSQWRDYHRNVAWLFDPWRGTRRAASDVGSDPFGFAIVGPDTPLYVERSSLLRDELCNLAQTSFKAGVQHGKGAKNSWCTDGEVMKIIDEICSRR